MASFNEAAGFTRRKQLDVVCDYGSADASMRPPDLPGGNQYRPCYPEPGGCGFNEAAGFTRRKRLGVGGRGMTVDQASMRPPDLPGGNH